MMVSRRIRHLILTILKLLGTATADEIYLKTKYPTHTTNWRIFRVGSRNERRNRGEGIHNDKQGDVKQQCITYINLPNKDQLGITTTKFTQIFKNSENGQNTGIILFMDEILNLLKRVNSKFNFAQHKSFVNRK